MLKFINSTMQKLLQLISVVLFCSFLIVVPSHTASLDFIPDVKNDFISDILGKGCLSTVQIFENLTGQSANATDIIVKFNPNEIDIKSISAGNAYGTFDAPSVNTSTGRIGILAYSKPPSPMLTSNKSVASINFINKLKPKSTSANFDFIIEGYGEDYTKDSNIADSQTNKDILSSSNNKPSLGGVQSGRYKFVDGYCEYIPPYINFKNPVDRQIDVETTSNVVVEVSDTGSGVDIDTVEFNINGKIYKANSNPSLNTPGLSYSIETDPNKGGGFSPTEFSPLGGKPLKYNILIDPTVDFFSNKRSTISGKATDFAKNTGTKTIDFDPPFICLPDTPDTPDTIVNITENRVQEVTENRVQEVINNESPKSSVIQVNKNDLPTFYYTLLSFFILPIVFFEFILLKKYRHVKGFVFNPETFEPLSYVPILAYDLSTKKLIDRKFTKMNGSYDFRLIPGEYELRIDTKHVLNKDEWNKDVSTSKYITKMLPIHLNWRQKIVVPHYNIIKRYTAYISGVVLNKTTNEPVKLIPVATYNLDTNELVDKKFTHKDGSYYFNLEPGKYEIRSDIQDGTWPRKIVFPKVGVSDTPELVDKEQGNRSLIWKNIVVNLFYIRSLVPGLWIAEFILALLNFYINPSLLNISIILLHILVFLIVFVIPYSYRKFVKPNLAKIESEE